MNCVIKNTLEIYTAIHHSTIEMSGSRHHNKPINSCYIKCHTKEASVTRNTNIFLKKHITTQEAALNTPIITETQWIGIHQFMYDPTVNSAIDLSTASIQFTFSSATNFELATTFTHIIDARNLTALHVKYDVVGGIVNSLEYTLQLYTSDGTVVTSLNANEISDVQPGSYYETVLLTTPLTHVDHSYVVLHINVDVDDATTLTFYGLHLN